MKLVIHTDGGARGNPGPAGIGIVIEEYDSQRPNVIREYGRTIGIATNNVAEYNGVISALEEVIKIRKNSHAKDLQIEFNLDSTLVVNQLNGIFKVKDANLRNLLMKIRILETEISGKIFYKYIPREQNSRADYWVNHALDQNI